MGAAKEVARPRVVLDTNVVVSALLFTRGSLAWLRDAWNAGDLIPLASRETVLEIVRSGCGELLPSVESEEREVRRRGIEKERYGEMPEKLALLAGRGGTRSRLQRGSASRTRSPIAWEFEELRAWRLR